MRISSYLLCISSYHYTNQITDTYSDSERQSILYRVHLVVSLSDFENYTKAMVSGPMLSRGYAVGIRLRRCGWRLGVDGISQILSSALDKTGQFGHPAFTIGYLLIHSDSIVPSDGISQI